MPTPVTYKLAEIDGDICIACTQTDWNAPNLITHYWPTTARARDLLYYLGIEPAEIGSAKVEQCRPGEYYARNPGRSGPVGVYLSLTHGGSTKPVKTDIAPYPKPRTRNRCEYRDGRWWKDSVKGWQQA